MIKMIFVLLFWLLIFQFHVSYIYCEEPRVFSDSDLESVKQSPMIDDESINKRNNEIVLFQKKQKEDMQRQKDLEKQEKDEKEIRNTWDNMKKALSGKPVKK